MVPFRIWRLLGLSQSDLFRHRFLDVPNVNETRDAKMAEGKQNGETAHWIVGDDDTRESYDDFPQYGDEPDSLPPHANSTGQGGLGGLAPSDQIALLERRKRLK